MSRGVLFNTSDLELVVPGLIITELPDRPPVRTLNMALIASTDTKALNSNNYTDRKVNIKCEIGRDTRAQLDSSMDTLNRILAPTEKVLVVPYGSSTRQYTATFKNMGKSNAKGGHIELDLEFECSDSMGYDTTNTTIVSHANNVGTPKSYFFLLDGSAEWQLPVITLTVNSLLGGENKNIVIGNQDTGQSITITRTWLAGDVLIIDAVNGTVQVNGVDVDFSGAIPKFKLPSGTLTYSDTISHRDVTIQAVYKKRWI